MTDWYSKMSAPSGDKPSSGGKDWYSEVTAPPESRAPKAKPERGMKDIVDEKLRKDGFDLGTMVSNIWPSTKRLAGDVATAVTSPVETAKTLGKVGYSFMDKGAQELVESLPEGVVNRVNKFNNALVDMGIPLERLPDKPEEMTFEDTEYAEQVIGFFGDRYGSVDSFLETLEEDPAGVVSDLAGVLSLGGSKAATVGAAIDPLNLATRGAAKAITSVPGVSKLPEKLYQSAVKFSTTKKPRERAAMTKTALENKIMPRTTGVDKLDNLIEGLNTKIDDLITDAASGETVSVKKVLKYVDDVKKEVGDVNLYAAEDLKKVDNIVQGYKEHLIGQGKSRFNAEDLQKLKKGIYKRISYNKKTMKGSQAGDITAKAIARAAKEEIEGIIPEVKQLNQKEGSLLELKEAIEKAASRIENRDLIGLGVPMKGAAGGIVGGPEGFAAAVTMGILDTPTVKAKLAIVLNDIQSLDISAARKRIISAQIAKIAGRAEQSLGDQNVKVEDNEEQDNAE